MEFYQTGPSLTNTYDSDSLLRATLKRILPADVLSKVEKHLTHVGHLAANDWLTWSREAEANKPKLVQFDAFGRRKDEIVISEGWRKLEAAAATEGIVACGYTVSSENFLASIKRRFSTSSILRAPLCLVPWR